METIKRRRLGVAATFFAAFVAALVAVRWPGGGNAKSKVAHPAPRVVAKLDARERASELLQIYRNLLRPGADNAYGKVEEDAARMCAEPGFPNPHLALESFAGPKGVW